MSRHETNYMFFWFNFLFFVLLSKFDFFRQIRSIFFCVQIETWSFFFLIIFSYDWKISCSDDESKHAFFSNDVSRCYHQKKSCRCRHNYHLKLKKWNYENELSNEKKNTRKWSIVNFSSFNAMIFCFNVLIMCFIFSRIFDISRSMCYSSNFCKKRWKDATFTRFAFKIFFFMMKIENINFRLSIVVYLW